MTTIRPMGKNVLVELDPLEQVSKGGIHLVNVDHHMKRPDGRWATVIATGPRCRLGLEAGQRVMVNGWLSDGVKNGRPGEYQGTVFINEDDVFMVACDTAEEARALVEKYERGAAE